MSEFLFPLSLRHTFEAVNSIYEHAARSGRVSREVLGAWYNGAMSFATGMQDTSGAQFSERDDLRSAFITGERGYTPLVIWAAADDVRRADREARQAA